METKPYNLQSPEQIAKDYGGNKQKIAEAMQMGILDPTAGTLAGMFIDRMRSAQTQEMAPQQTVAQQVFAPPAPPMGAMPPAGLGATPEAGAMAGAPPQMMGSAPLPPQGMAAGGLTTLPLPDDMFSEPDYGGYASGGLVAFAAGTGPEGVVDPDVPNFDGGEHTVTGPEEEEEEEEERGKIELRPVTPDYRVDGTLYGFGRDLGANADKLEEISPYRTEEAGQYAKYLRSQLGPEQRAQRRQENMWTMLGQIGARMASTPGSLLQAIGAGVGEAVPNVARSLSEQRAEERGVRQALLGEERTGNREVADRANTIMEMANRYGGFAEAMKDRAFADYHNSQSLAVQERVARINADANIRTTQINTAGGITQARIGATAGERRDARQLMNSIMGLVREDLGVGGVMRAPYTAAVRAGTGEQFRDNLIQSYARSAGLDIAPRSGAAPPPPEGMEIDRRQ